MPALMYDTLIYTKRSKSKELKFKTSASSFGINLTINNSRVVQYYEIMRFMIPCDRHHKVSPNPNP